MDEPLYARAQAPADLDIATRRRSPVRAILGAALVSFLLGAVALYLLLGSPSLGLAQRLGLADAAVPASVAPVTAGSVNSAPVAAQVARQAEARAVQVAEQQGGLDQRIAAMEQRVTRLDLQAEAAAGNAARAEGLLIAFASRRALERGAPLGYLADQLRLRFGDAQPNAVQTVINAGQRPVTLDQLVARLDNLAPAVSRPPRGEGLGDWLSREFGHLFVVRRQDAPSPAAEQRLQRAHLFLESGRADAAAAEVRLLPNAADGAGWIADAQRYAAVQRALDLIETAAILEPRELRNGQGARIQQPGPVG